MKRALTWMLTALLPLLARPASAQGSQPGPPLPGTIIKVPVLPVPDPAATDQPGAGTPLSLAQAVHLALEHNPDILNLAFQLGQEEAALRIAKETWYPTASFQGSGNYQSTGGVGGSGFGSQELSESGSVGVAKTLADFGVTRARVAAAEAGLCSARANLLEKQEDVALIVRQQYFTAIADTELATIDGDSVADQDKHLAQALAFYREGTRARLDVAQAQASVAAARLTLVQAENTRDRDFMLLNNAMGLAQACSYELNAQSGTTTDPVPQVTDAPRLLDAAYHERPDLLSLLAQMQAAQANLALAHMGFNPVLTSAGSMSMFATSGQTTPGFGVGVSLLVPLLDAGATHAGVQAATAALNSLVAQQTSLQNGIYTQVQVDLRSLHQAVVSVEEAHSGEAAATEAYQLANRRYRAGLGSSLDFVDAQLAYSQARSARVTAESQVRTAEAQLDHDTGRTDFF